MAASFRLPDTTAAIFRLRKDIMGVPLPPLVVIGKIHNVTDGVRIYANQKASGDGKLRVIIETEYQLKWDKTTGVIQIIIDKIPDKLGVYNVEGVSESVRLPWTNGIVGVSFNKDLIKKDWFVIRPEIGNTATINLSERSLPKYSCMQVG